ncbi:hypothetical protein ERO13_D12G171901v2 [Gossypium hirsutum]|nr:hypothetical protein ERO13_D12G171901v2 [Gossypium hirsutum]KAG4116479.1 hypothetical protein ERO13_D12G171901v2 [Gossypium hirsutum]
MPCSPHYSYCFSFIIKIFTVSSPFLFSLSSLSNVVKLLMSSSSANMAFLGSQYPRPHRSLFWLYFGPVVSNVHCY